MNIKKYLKPIGQILTKRRRFGFGLWHFGKPLSLLHLLLPALVGVVVVGTVVTQVPGIRLAAFKFTKPKPIIASSTQLPENIQQAIQNLASQEIKQEQANANLAINDTQTAQVGVVQNAILSIQETLASNPSEKAKLELKIIDNLIAKLQKQSPDQLVEIIKEIGQKTDQIVRNPNVQADRGVLQLLIEQYNRLQIILQQLEDKLPVADYLKVEDARQKYLVVTAMASINNAPNLDSVHNIALKEVEKVVGKDFAELKAIEIISDFEAGIKPESREKLNGLEKELAVQFEKRMLKLPKDVREKKLQEFIKYSFGNPIRQVESFDKMKGFLSKKELISGVDSLRKLALQKVKTRISESNSEEKIQNFLESELKDPKDIKKLEDEAKKLPEIKLTKEEQQALYEKIQQIVQRIFLTSKTEKSDLEKQLPEDIQNQIQKLKQELAARNIPKITTPQGVILPEVAKLPDDVENAIIIAAKKKIEVSKRPKDIELDLTVQAKDLKVADPIILPENPFYIFKRVFRNLSLLLKLDSLTRAQTLISQDNEKTLEAAKLIKQNQDIKTIDLALATLREVQQDFNKLKSNADKLEQLKINQPKKVDQLVDQIIENGIARQTVLSAIEDKVYGDTYVEVEKIRSDILKDGVDTLLQLTDNNVAALTDKLEKAIQEVSGSDLAEIKAIELLVEIKKDQPQNFQPILENSIDQIAQKLEAELLTLPEQERIEKVLDYVDASPGNPVIQFEAADELKSHFTNSETISLTEGIKDKAVENLTDLISEISEGVSKQEFVDTVVGDKPEDLKIITDIESRVTPPSGEITPIVEEVKEIKAEVEQNIIDVYKDNPTQLAADITKTEEHVTDILDVKTVQEIADILASSPEVAPEVVKEAQKLETEVVNNFVEDVSKEASQALTPVPEVIAELVELKDQTPPSVDVKIDAAIKAEVKLIEEHLTQEVTDPQTFENYVSQIQGNPVVEQVVTSVGGTEFTQAIEKTTQEIQTTATSEQTTLLETVKQVEQEIFTAPVNQPSSVEQTLPQTVQEEIKEVKQEVPVEQVPQVTVEAQVTVTAPTAAPPPPAPQPAPAVAPAPEAPTVAPPPAALPTL